MSFRQLSPLRINAYKSVCYTLCLAVIFASLPWPLANSTANAQGNKDQPVLSRSLPSDYKLPNLNAVLNEGKTRVRPELPRPALKPSTICGYRDKACEGLKKERERVGQNTMPLQKQTEQQTAKQKGASWLNRLGQKLAGILPSNSLGALTASTATNNFVAPERSTAATRANAPIAATTSTASPFTPPPLITLTEARLDPRYRIGGAAEDLFSGNMHWSLPLVSLPGRGGLDLNLSLHYNSLVWAKYTNVVEFEYDHYPTLTAGFRLGLPELEGPLTVRYVNTYIVMLPTGRRVEMRQVSTNRFEAIDSSYLYLVVNPTAQTATLYGTDGTQWRYAVPPNGYQMRCTQVIDANGNYLTIDYKTIGNPASYYLVETDKITDTLGRVITFNYDVNLHLQSITQSWGGQTFTWAQFDYGTQTIQTNFGPNIVKYGPANNTSIPVITRVITADGARHGFVYNSWGQMQDIFTYGEADNLRAVLDYEFPTASTQLADCPRFYQRNDYIVNWAGATGGGWASNNFYFDPSEAYGEVTLPNGVKYREVFNNSSDGKRGLTTRTETWHSGVVQQFTEISWDSDSTTSPPLRPRVTETKIVDDRNHDNDYDNGIDKQRRTTIEYIFPMSTLRLPAYVREYNADGTTVYRSTETDYVVSNYILMGTTTRRIIGLPSYTALYEGDFTKLIARTEYSYDSANESGSVFLQAHTSTPRQHDSTNYGSSFLYRGNLTKARRFSVVNGVASAPIETKSGYFTTGNAAWARDGRGDETQFFYEDAFTAGLTTSPSPATFAYPTKVTQIDSPTSSHSQFKYHFDHGGVTETIDPKSFNASPANLAKVVNTYDTKGRLEQASIYRGGAEYSHTRNSYSTDHNWVQTFSTVNTLAEETVALHLLDGIGRERITISDHPGSTGTLRSQYRVFDVMGRVVEWSNPTEINVYWSPTGDDPLYIVSKQEYDWKGRPTILYHQDHTTQSPRKREYSYTGCGCAGNDATTLTDEVGRVQKFYTDLFGRQTQTELWNGSSIYTTTQTKYNVRDQVEEYKQMVGTVGASLIATNEYDGHGRLWRKKLPVEGVSTPGTRFTYHDDDEVATVTDPRNVVATYTYNARALVTNVSYNISGAPSNVASFGPVSYTYDEAGNRTNMTDAAGNTTYAYDNLSRITSEGRIFNDISTTNRYFLYYQYNLAGQVKEVKDHFNDVIYYDYDKVGRVTKVTGADLTRSEQYQFTSTVANTLIKYRAWDGVKHMKYGNNLVSTATYDKRMRPFVFEVTGKVQNSFDPDPSPLAMKTEHEYYADSQPRYIKDHKDRAYDRAYKWDFANRLEESYSGDEATIFAGKPQSYTPGPYRQSYQHDTFGRMIGRTNRFWSKNAGLTVSFNPVTGQTQNTVDTDLATGQQTTGPTWQYNGAGNVTQDNNLKYFYNAAGLNWQAQDLTNAPKATHEFDGDGRAVKRAVVNMVTTHYLNSTVLGLPITEVNNSGGKEFMNVYLGATRIAQLRDGTGFSIPPDKWVIWDHLNPVTSSNARSTEQSWYFRESEPDPLGVNVGFDDPYAPPVLPPDTEAEPGLPALLPGAGETGKRCSLDGIIVDCGFVAPLIEAEAVVKAPDKNIVPVYRRHGGEFVGYAFFDPNQRGYAFSYWVMEQSRNGYRFTDEYGRVLANDSGGREWEWVKKTEVFETSSDLVGKEFSQTQELQQTQWRIMVPPLSTPSRQNTPQPCGVNPVTGRPGFTPTPKGVGGNLRPGVGGEGFYRARRAGGRRQHAGLDISGGSRFPLIYASRDGVITRTVNNATPGVGYGKLIEITHDNGITTRYAHNTLNLFSVGTHVRAGQAIGLMGQTGNAAGQPLSEAHVHFEVRLNGRDRPPATFLNLPCAWQIALP